LVKNIRDWCISRKIWWGQQMPVWYCQNCGDEAFIVSQKKPKTKCKNVKIKIGKEQKKFLILGFLQLFGLLLFYILKVRKNFIQQI
jgi:valyl-tRNA synthetase